jgi:SM-20-related protein
MRIALNPALDADDLAEAYRARRRLQIRDLLTEPSAEEVFGAIEAVPWGLAYNEGSSVVELDANALARLSREEAARIMAGIHERARSGYQFLYSYYPLLTAYFTPGAERLPLFEMFEFINSPPFIDFIRRVTGLADIRWADGQATLFRAGHFLKYHTDESPSEQRLAAYVINMTKGWGRDWGGYLQFFDEHYDVEQAFRPVFNAINIFTIPADHSVSMVSSYAPGNRYSITGWFRGDDPPGPIG